MNETSELQLRRVVLYKIGLGFFEKRGKIKLNQQKSVKVAFRNTSMNDLLKTFSILRTKGDLVVSGMSYDGENTNRAKLLEDSLINLPENDTMAALLGQLRGFYITFKIGKETIQGILIGLQSRIEPIGPDSDKTSDEIYMVVRLSNGEVHAYKAREITRLEFPESVIAEDFRFFLDVIRSTKSEKFRSVTLFFDGSQESEFIVTFLAEAPAWKMSYRIFLIDENKNEGENPEIVRFRIQGWGIIENVLDEDWTGVRLTLASGVPISFKYDSYSPLWVSRPTITRGQKLDVTPTPDQGIIPSQGRTGMRNEMDGTTGQQFKSPLDAVNTLLESSAVKGAGFYYHVPHSVNVKRNQACLIPILEEKVETVLVSVYNADIHATHPMNTLEFKNTTGLILESGPVSLFKNNIFEGEALLPYLEKEETAKIPYAIDQSIEIHKEVKNVTHHYHRIEFTGKIYCYYFSEQVTRYQIRNITEETRKLILEHPKRVNWVFFESPDPTETTANVHRFRFDLKPSENREFILHERREDYRSEDVKSISITILDDWKSKKLIEATAYSRLKIVLDILLKIDGLSKILQQIQEDRQAIASEQERLRKNLDALGETGSEKSLRQRYVNKFEKREAELEQKEKQSEQIEKEIADLEAKLEQFQI